MSLFLEINQISDIRKYIMADNEKSLEYWIDHLKLGNNDDIYFNVKRLLNCLHLVRHPGDEEGHFAEIFRDSFSVEGPQEQKR
jgi:hypothetical protein